MLKDREMLGSELRDKIELYSELTGQDGWNVPITKVADFMSGFEMAKEKFKKRGHWIEQGDEYIEVHDISGKHTYAAEYKCNICGFIHTCIEDVGLYNFCPECGADMRGE